MPRVKRVFPDLPYITGSINTKIVVTDDNDYALGYTHINTLLDTLDNSGLATDGENVFTGNQLVFGNLTINGDIVANQFLVTTSSVTHYTASTNFGLDNGDTHTFTGSVRVTGSLNTIGSSTITGSFLVSGSTIQIGNNTLIGNTVLSGSIEVSGSTNFRNHTITMTGSMFTSGSQVITGSLDVKGNINVASGSEFYLAGNKLFNYGAFYDTRTQSGSLNVSQSIQFNSTDYSHGVSISNNTRVVLENVGIYNIQFSAQILDDGPGDSTIHIWIKKNGQNVPNSAGRIFLKANQEIIASWNYIVPASSPNDYYELVWQSTDADARILYIPATGNIPASPSIILTVTQVA